MAGAPPTSAGGARHLLGRHGQGQRRPVAGEARAAAPRRPRAGRAGTAGSRGPSRTGRPRSRRWARPRAPRSGPARRGPATRPRRGPGRRSTGTGCRRGPAGGGGSVSPAAAAVCAAFSAEKVNTALDRPPTWYVGSPVTPRGSSLTRGTDEAGGLLRGGGVGDLADVGLLGHLEVAVRGEVGQLDQVGLGDRDRGDLLGAEDLQPVRGGRGTGAGQQGDARRPRRPPGCAAPPASGGRGAADGRPPAARRRRPRGTGGATPRRRPRRARRPAPRRRPPRPPGRRPARTGTPGSPRRARGRRRRRRPARPRAGAACRQSDDA